MKTKQYAKALGLASVITLASTALIGSHNIATQHNIPQFAGDSAHLAGFGFHQNNSTSHLTPLDTSAAGQQEIPFVITLNLRHENKLNQLILDQANPSSPHFQKYLSVKEFTRRFGPTTRHYLDVINYLTSNGIRIMAVTPNQLLIKGEGTSAQLNKLFGVEAGVYQTPNGKVVFKSLNKPEVPSSLSGFVKNVIVQNSLGYYHYQDNLTINYQAPIGTPTGYGPQELNTVYNYPNMNNQDEPTGKVYSGHGVTIGIATAQTYSLADVDAYWDQFGITRTGTLTKVSIGGKSHTLNIETTLDTEQIGSDVPGANIIVYEARNPSSLDFALMFNRIVTDNKVSVLSHSWGSAENQTSTADMATENEIFQEAAAQGIAVFAASGDSGAYDTNNGFLGFQSNVPSVDFPSSDPYVVAVGGTTLVLNTDDSRDLEAAWNGSGGGMSSFFARPVWQVGPGVPHNNQRNSADVAMDADPNTGMPILYQNQWIEAGGTSFAAPNWAAGWALAVEAAHHRIGMPDLYLYKIGASKDYSSIFYDVTYGNNGDNGVGPGYNAGVGYDHPTGWGTPNMAKLIQWLVNYRAMPQAVA